MRFIHPRALPCACVLAAFASPARAQPADATGLSGRWTGTYECYQGTTALQLDLRGNAHGIVRGTFRFSAAAGNPDVPTGRYPVMGRYTGTSLVLRPIDVTEMPGAYVPVVIQATVAGQRMAGWIEGPGCGAVTVERTEAARPRDPLPDGYGRQRWGVIADGEAGRLYLDARPPRVRASVRQVWMRWETLQDVPEQGLRAGEVAEWEVELDCRAGLVRTWHALAFGADGELTSFESSMPYAWEPVTEGSLNQLAAEAACAAPAPPAERP